MSEQDQDKDLGVGSIPQEITPMSIPAQPEPVTVTESALDDEAPVMDIDLPEQVRNEEPTSQTAEPATTADEGVADKLAEESPAAEKSIWDDCEVDEIPESNLSNLKPVFEFQDAPEGVDMALPPSNERNITLLGGSKEINDDHDFLWMLNLQQSGYVSPKDNVMARRLQRPGADWSQVLPVLDKDGKTVNVAFLPAGKKPALSPGQRVQGADALDRFMHGTSMGSPVTVPLTNTGIWVKLNPAPSSFLAELDRTLAYARLQVGLDTNGMTGSVDDLIFREIINEAAMKLITATNYPVRNIMDLRDIIDDEDHKTLSWALAKVIYPKGVMISIPCIDPTCGEVSTFRANPARMHLIDRSRLNEKQRLYLSRGISTPMTEEDVADYKAQFKKTTKYSVRIENREFIFRSPTISQKLQIGRAWLSTVNQAVDTAMATTPDDDNKRNDVIRQITTIEQICRWGHYVSEIRVYNGEEDNDENFYVIDDEDTIRTILKSLSSAPEIVDTLIEAIEEFLVEIGTTIIGYPNTPCRKCKHENVPEKLKKKLVLPFDPDTGFFILAQRKISQAGGSPLTDLSTFGIENLGVQAQVRALEESSNLDLS